MIGGNPARLIKKRFDDDMIELLLRVTWWDLDVEKITQIPPVLCDPDLDRVKTELRTMPGR